MKTINKIILVITMIIFSWIMFFSLFYNSNVFYKEYSIISIPICIGILFLWKKIFEHLPKSLEKISRKKEILLVCGYFVFVLIMQYIILKQLKVEPGWDFGVVLDNALNYAKNGSRNGSVYMEYFQLFPNNIFIFLMMIVSIKIGMIFGIGGYASTKIMNAIFIDMTLLILYQTIRKRYGIKEGIFALIISLFFVAMFLYTPIPYTDTLSLFIGISFIYIFSYFKEDFKKQDYILWFLIGILIFLGKSIKITSVIVFIALLINYCFTHKIKNSIKGIAIASITFLLLNSVMTNWIEPAGRFAFKVNDYGSYPYTHWIMMGVEDKDADNSGRNTYGGYNINDYNKTLSFKTGKEAQSYNLKEYVRRVKKLGPVGYIMFLTKKNVNIWTDGYYFANVALGINPIKPNSFLQKLIRGDNTKYIGIYFTQGVQFAFLIIVIIGAYLSLKKKKVKEIDYLRLSLIGVFLFLSLWEGRSRYLVNFIPIFIVIITDFYAEYGIKNNKKKNTKKRRVE